MNESMRNLTKSLFQFGLPGLFLACTSSQHLSAGSDVVGVDLPLRQSEHVIKLSEVADSIRYVPLETTDSCLIGSMDKLLLTDEVPKVAGGQ